ncbi:hypothetical protein JSY17_02115 [Pseudomonas capsici]|uniref:type VI secretion system-associated FHA domain protein n=1 Tax=Pseudomonas capsici TaxID=2810614 RepID=UPI0019D2EC81|nr:type VI secretion system-associated FHA domain protein [Pseudomonas capsici]MBN6712778.1 hypothetical protein [Pseudomonas capsici]MBN6717485.1 hypothetical protein [Pseudomonas capsici]MBN6723464.1 hypothetical protein [Pseudomonas capsici]
METFFDERNALLDPGAVMDHACVDTECLLLPALIDMPPAEPCRGEPEVLTEDFWKAFGEALGINLDHLDSAARKALALNTARLFRQCVGGLKRNLSTCRELKSELQLAPESIDPFEQFDISTAIDGLLYGKLKVSSLVQAFRDLQAHQVAMLDASRTLARATFEYFSPQQLTWQFERDGALSSLPTAGRRWRAYVRHYQSLEQEHAWEERLLLRNFVHAYEEQIQLINTLYLDVQG